MYQVNYFGGKGWEKVEDVERMKRILADCDYNDAKEVLTYMADGHEVKTMFAVYRVDPKCLIRID